MIIYDSRDCCCSSLIYSIISSVHRIEKLATITLYPTEKCFVSMNLDRTTLSHIRVIRAYQELNKSNTCIHYQTHKKYNLVGQQSFLRNMVLCPPEFDKTVLLHIYNTGHMKWLLCLRPTCVQHQSKLIAHGRQCNLSLTTISSWTHTHRLILKTTMQIDLEQDLILNVKISTIWRKL